MSRLYALLLLLATTATVHAQALTVDQGWIRSGPPGATVLAGYARLSNPGTTELRIVEARSSSFASVEFHETLDEDGVAKMRAVEALVIPAGGSLTLEPGGLHLMLIKPTRRLMLGDSVVLDMITDEGDALPAAFTMRSMPAGEHDHHDHHHHHEHGDHRH
jgi:periplasmic copper chaperone A